MRIRFSEHVGEGYREGCVHELEEMGATVDRQDERAFSVHVMRSRKYPPVVEFLRQEERAGILSVEQGGDE